MSQEYPNQQPQQPPQGYYFQPSQGPYAPVPPKRKSHKGLWIMLGIGDASGKLARVASAVTGSIA